MTNANSDLTLVVIGDENDIPLHMYSGPDVYQPYRETGNLWTYMREEFEKKDSLVGLKFAEFGAGTAAFSVMTKKYYSDLDVYAYDNDPNSEKYMVANSELHNVSININIQDVADISDSEQFDFIVSSPPFYAYQKDSMDLAIIGSPNKQDPESSMYAGETGLEIQAIFLEKAGKTISQGGAVLVTHLEGQTTDIYALLELNGFTVDRTTDQRATVGSAIDCVYTIAYKN